MTAYKDNEKYIFISYARKDSERVLPTIEALQFAGFRVWYDTNIEPAEEFPAYIQEHLKKSTVFVSFISSNSVESPFCRKEITYAVSLNKEILVIKLEDTELKNGLDYNLCSLQHLNKYRYSSEKSFRNDLLNTPILQKCKTEKFKLGNTIAFGSYLQNYGFKSEIEWQVLDVKDEKVLLISKYALDCKPYHITAENVTWETCTLRKWLNNDFLNTAFSKSEKEKILQVSVFADKNPSFNTNSGNTTQDKIFLLSISEAIKYFADEIERICYPTAFAIANGAYVNHVQNDCIWWLRSPGSVQNSASCINSNRKKAVGSDIDTVGGYVNNYCNAIRPALWIDLNT